MALKRMDAGRALALALALLLALALALLFPGGFAVVNQRLADFGWRLWATDSAEERIVIVDIDERSLSALGPWPWPRARLAELARRLGEAGAALQVWDLVLDAPREGDEELARALGRNRALLSVAFAFPGQGEPVESGRLDPRASVGTLPCGPLSPAAHGHRAPAESLAGIPVGHIAPRVDSDGVVRAMPAWVCRHGLAWPALPVAAWLSAVGAQRPSVEPGRGAFEPPWKILAENLPEPLPLGASGEILVPWARSPRAFVAFPAADVLAGRIPAARIESRIALVGSTALGVAERVMTPFAGAQSGVLVHAELLAGLLDGRLPREPRAKVAIEISAAIAAALLLFVLASLRPAAWILPAAALLFALALLALQLLLLRGFFVLAMAAPALGALFCGIALGMLEHWRAGGERKRLYGHLSAYLPAPVADALVALRPGDAPAAEPVEASVLVADLRNFTAWSEARGPEEVARLLHRFLATAVEVVESTGGEVEALQGDAVLAVWNGLRPCPGHALRALEAARTLLERASRDLPPADPEGRPPALALGIGCDSGRILAGSVGPSRRRQHLALGLPVTRALRLAALTAELSTPILVGPGLAALLPPEPRARLVSQGEFLLEGLTQSCEVHALG